jgi:nitrate reductase (NAD(P)H)
MLPAYHVGSLDDAGMTALSAGEGQPVGETKSRSTFLQPRVWTKAVLSGKKIVSWDTRIFTYRLEHPEQTLGLPIGQHLMIRLRDPVTRDAIIRSYTPISDVNDKGSLEMLVKVYFDSAGLKGGKMSQAMDALPIGHSVDFKGPIGKFEYLGKGDCALNGVRKTVKSFLMICGGSGITPIYQVFRAVMRDPEDRTHCVVLDGNRLFEDILCKEELDRLAAGNDHRCKLLYTLTKAPDEWEGLRGRISGKLVQEHCQPDPHTLILICGPEALEKSMHTALLEQGWNDKNLIFF